MENAMGKSKETGLVVEYQPQKWEIPFCPVSWFHFSDWLAESIVTSMNFADILDFNSAVTRRTIMKCEIGNCKINDDIFYSINTMKMKKIIQIHFRKNPRKSSKINFKIVLQWNLLFTFDVSIFIQFWRLSGLH